MIFKNTKEAKEYFEKLLTKQLEISKALEKNEKIDFNNLDVIKYANSLSILRVIVMLLNHINFIKQANKLEKAFDESIKEKKMIIAGNLGGVSYSKFGDHILNKLKK